ncbi:MAG: M36 family metallopeptidase [Kofleriaceae bacterium]
MSMTSEIRTRVRRAALVAMVVASGCADRDATVPAVDATTGAGATARQTLPGPPAPIDQRVVAVARDDAGRPRLLRAVAPVHARAATPAAGALELAEALASVWGVVAPADLAVDSVHTLRNGATLVALRQEVGGVPVWAGRLSVLTAPDGALVAIGGTRVARTARAKGAFSLDGRAATERAVADRFPVGTKVGPSQVKRALLAEPGGLRPTWVVEAYGAPAGSTSSRLWRVFVDATTGAIARRDDLTVDAAFAYRVFADADSAGRPFDGPQQSFAPHPSGAPDGSQPAFVAPNLVTMDGFNTSADPWLAAGATATNGNNVDAYADIDAPDGLSGTDFRATATAPGVFDRVYDVAQGPLASQAQGMAAVTHLFYVNNWLHDWWYDSGFDEAAGNAQQDNYGRGGVGGDPLHAEAQDGAAAGNRNNANMSTPSDGLSPRMQMFLWSGAPAPRSVTITPGNLAFASATAAFGVQSFDLTAAVVDASDASHQACGAITGATGKIVLVDRGSCSYVVKAGNVQAAGGIGVLIVNNTTGLANMGGTGATLPPTLMISQADGATLRGLLSAGPTTAHLLRGTAGVERDGDLDTAIVAHEWGHYLHHRLAACGAAQCSAMSEGWGDFSSLMALVRPTDDPHAAYPMGVYAAVSFADAYFGLRRAPYSTNFAFNGFTFRHIQQSATLPSTFPISFSGNNQEVHNAGEVWTAMLWQAYVAMIDQHGYATARRAMADYVVASLLLSPADATYTEARDALLAAAHAIAPADAGVLAQAFAVRGAGSCAASPPRDSTTLDGVVEDFMLRGNLAIGAITIDDSGVSCDNDGLLDAGETGQVAVTLINHGSAALTGTTITVSTTTPGVTIVAPSRGVGAIAPLTSAVETFTIRMAPTVTTATPIAIAVEATDAGACTATVTAAATIAGNFDVIPDASATDDVEADATVWTRTGTTGMWSRAPVGASVGWHGLDLASVGDGQLVSPPLPVGAGNLVVSFTHRFDFEFSGGTYWDGGVLELSTDSGVTWNDVSTYGVTPGYIGTITDTSGNVLANRLAYARQNPAYPATDTVSLDFGPQFSGQTVQLRFRVGTDQAVGGGGWELDDLTFTGITTTPFPVLAPEGPTCQVAPLVNAGPDQAVSVGASVALGGTATDPNGDGVTVAWTQTAGPAVTLSGADTLTPTFTAPATPTSLTFALTASDPFASASDEVVIDVALAPPIDAGVDAPTDAAVDAAAPGDAGTDAPPAPIDAAPAIDATTPTGPAEGGCCSTGDTGAPGATLLALGALGLLLRPRRRR